MGTNYYATTIATEKDVKNIIEKVEKGDFSGAQQLFPEEVHIGKSSMGWQFTFNHNNWEYFDDLHSLKSFLKKSIIRNEYNEIITYKYFWNLVKQKEKGREQGSYGITKFSLQFSNSTNFS